MYSAASLSVMQNGGIVGIVCLRVVGFSSLHHGNYLYGLKPKDSLEFHQHFFISLNKGKMLQAPQKEDRGLEDISLSYSFLKCFVSNCELRFFSKIFSVLPQAESTLFG